MQAYITPNLSGGTREPEPSAEPGRGSIGITMASVRFWGRTEKMRDRKRRPEGGEREPIKIFFRESLAYNPKRAPQALSSRVCKV